jgi:hypothetical protein
MHSTRARRVIRCLILLIVPLLTVPAVASADGDPASDVLLSQPLFLPSDAGVPGPEQARLATLLQSAQRSGTQIRVALIAAPADLGSVTELWRQPQLYARFLGQELSLIYHGPLLVVMPAGYGLYGPVRKSAALRAALAELLPPARGGPGLAAGALRAVERLAAATGHPLAVTAQGAPTAAQSADPVPWVSFAVGLVLIAAAWTASLRAKPLRPRS